MWLKIVIHDKPYVNLHYCTHSGNCYDKASIILLTHKTPHSLLSWVSYGMSIVNILEKIDHTMRGLQHHHMGVKAYQITRNQLFIQQLIQASNKETKALHYCAFVKGIKWSPVESPHKGPGIWKEISYHEITMIMATGATSPVNLPIDHFTVSLHSPNSRYLPAVMAVQGDCQWPLQNGGNSHQSCEPQRHHMWGVLESIFRSANHRWQHRQKTNTTNPIS